MFLSTAGSGNRHRLTPDRAALYVIIGCLLLGDCMGAALARATEPEKTFIMNPHLRSKCIACHIAEDDETFLTEDMNALCSRCHDQTDPRWKHHPIRKVPQGMVIPKYWETEDGLLTCVTCHTPGHEEDREVPMLLRDGPYRSTASFCRLCHPLAGKGAADPHRACNDDRQACLVCHETMPVIGKDTFNSVSLTASMQILCLMCHDYSAHPGGTDHNLRRNVRPGTILPDRLRELDQGATCASCHNPHIKENDGHKLRDSAVGEDTCWRCHPQ